MPKRQFLEGSVSFSESVIRDFRKDGVPEKAEEKGNFAGGQKKNGQLSAWLDGRLVGNVEGLRLRDSDAVRIRRFAVNNYFGGDNVMDTSPQDQRIYIDNLIISRKPIGCLYEAG